MASGSGPSTTPLYVRIASEQARRLDHVAASTGRSKRRLVEEAVGAHLLDGPEGLTVGRITLPEPEPEVLTAAEAALLLRLHEAEVVAAAAAGELPGRLLAGQWRFLRAALLASLQQP